jgi:hypothetical protein
MSLSKAARPISVERLIWIICATTAVVAFACTVRDSLAFFGGFTTGNFPLAVFRLDSELSLPAWYSGCLMLVSAQLAFAISWRQATVGGRDRGWWLALGLGLAYLSLDEIAAVHERVMDLVNRHIQTSGVFTFSWLLVGIPAVAAAGAIFLPFLLRQEKRTRWLLVLSGAIFLAGAIGCEMLGGLFSSTYRTQDTLSYFVVSTLEELLEMTGFTLLVATLLVRLRDDLRGTSIVLR